MYDGVKRHNIKDLKQKFQKNCFEILKVELLVELYLICKKPFVISSLVLKVISCIPLLVPAFFHHLHFVLLFFGKKVIF